MMLRLIGWARRRARSGLVGDRVCEEAKLTRASSID